MKATDLAAALEEFSNDAMLPALDRANVTEAARVLREVVRLVDTLQARHSMTCPQGLAPGYLVECTCGLDRLRRVVGDG